MNYYAIEAMIEEMAAEEWTRIVEDAAYNTIIIPDYMAALDAEAKTV